MSENSFFEQDLTARINKRKEAGLLRSLMVNNRLVDFCSNDYIGFSQHPDLYIPSEKPMESGATGSRLISGNSIIAEETEELIAKYHDTPAALIFNTGYMANVGLFSCIASKGDTFISDEYIHASIIDGMRLSYANRLRFKHNNLEDLEKKILLATGKKIVVVESVYSMDGDEAPLKEIATLCKKHAAILIVDEAHATGLYGENGEGLVCKNQLQNEVFAVIHTFGKAMGLHAAAITGSKVLRNFLLNQARSFIFTTALPPANYLQIQQAYSMLPFANRTELFSLINYFKLANSKLQKIKFINSHSPIQGILVSDNFKTKALATHLMDNGFFVRPILSPTVPVGKERIRICLHSFNTEAQIDQLIKVVENFK